MPDAARLRRGASLSAATAAPKAQRPLTGIALMLLAVFTFTLLDTTAKSLVGHYPVVEIVWGRYLFNLLLLALALPVVGPARLARTARPALQVGRALLLLTATASMFAAVRFLPLAETYAITFISPLIVAALSGPLLGERVGARRWLAIACGFSGVLVVMRPGGAAFSWAMVFPLSMAIAYATYQVVTRLMSTSENTLTTLFYTALVGTLVTSLLVPFSWVSPQQGAWLLMAATGLFGLVGHGLLFLAFRSAPAAVLSPFVYSQIVWAAVLGYVFFRDVPDGPTLLGAGIVVASGLLLAHEQATTRALAKRVETANGEGTD